ncbi:Uncharacterised protein [Mycobacteroides abscessus]|nr:Uncharacterised protein [Mycobacteroides abscessus]
MSILETGLLITTVLCIAANGFEVAAKAVKAQFVVQNSGEVGLAPRWLPYLAVVEGAGVVGLVIGLPECDRSGSRPQSVWWPSSLVR